MKKLLFVCILAFTAFAFQSCAGPGKYCAAYAKHQPEAPPGADKAN